MANPSGSNASKIVKYFRYSQVFTTWWRGGIALGDRSMQTSARSASPLTNRCRGVTIPRKEMYPIAGVPQGNAGVDSTPVNLTQFSAD